MKTQKSNAKFKLICLSGELQQSAGLKVMTFENLDITLEQITILTRKVRKLINSYNTVF